MLQYYAILFLMTALLLWVWYLVVSFFAFSDGDVRDNSPPRAQQVQQWLFLGVALLKHGGALVILVTAFHSVVRILPDHAVYENGKKTELSVLGHRIQLNSILFKHPWDRIQLVDVRTQIYTETISLSFPVLIPKKTSTATQKDSKSESKTDTSLVASIVLEGMQTYKFDKNAPTVDFEGADEVRSLIVAPRLRLALHQCALDCVKQLQRILGSDSSSSSGEDNPYCAMVEPKKEKVSSVEFLEISCYIRELKLTELKNDEAGRGKGKIDWEVEGSR